MSEGREIGKQLCEAWGIDPHDVMRMTISVTPMEAMVVVTMTPDPPAERGMVHRKRDFVPTLAKYRLTPIEVTP